MSLPLSVQDDAEESRFERVKQRILAEAARPTLEPAGDAWACYHTLLGCPDWLGLEYM